MNNAHSRRLRISSCIQTILDVHARYRKKPGLEEMLEKFRQLEINVDALENPHISEGDVLRVEKATNRLLDEIKLLRKFDDPADMAGTTH